MKKVFFVLLMCTILFAAIYAMCDLQSEKKTAREMLLDEGWEEYALVTSFYEGKEAMEHDRNFMIFCKKDLYIAVRAEELNLKNYTVTKFSVTKDNYWVLGESYDGRISFVGSLLYFNF